MEKKRIIEAMHNRLHEIDPHAKAILFGSRARGTEHEGSDWDVLILLDKPKVTLQDYDKYSYPLRELGWDMLKPLSIITCAISLGSSLSLNP